jgi:hypothetical protein
MLVCGFYNWWAAFWLKKSTTQSSTEICWVFHKFYSLVYRIPQLLDENIFIKYQCSVAHLSTRWSASLPSQLSNIGQILTVEETKWETRHDSCGQEVKYTLQKGVRYQSGANKVCALMIHDKWNSECMVKGKCIRACFPCQEHLYEIGVEPHLFLTMKDLSWIFYCCWVFSDNICNSAYTAAVHLTQSSYEKGLEKSAFGIVDLLTWLEMFQSPRMSWIALKI